MFHSRLYLGGIVHQGQTYPGQHAAIIERDTRRGQARNHRSGPGARAASARRGLGATLSGRTATDRPLAKGVEISYTRAFPLLAAIASIESVH